jgi:hypothetical protein
MLLHKNENNNTRTNTLMCPFYCMFNTYLVILSEFQVSVLNDNKAWNYFFNISCHLKRF